MFECIHVRKLKIRFCVANCVIANKYDTSGCIYILTVKHLRKIHNKYTDTVRLKKSYCKVHMCSLSLTLFQIQLCYTNSDGSVNGNGVGGRMTSARGKSRPTNGINGGGASRQSNGARSHRKSPPSSPPIKLAASVFRWAGQRLRRQATDNALMARRRVIRLLMTVVVSFAVCVAPYHIRMLWQTWSHPNMTFGTLLVPPITFVMYYLNSAVNPMLYAFLSVNFRKSLIEVVTCANQNRTRSRNGPFSASGRTVHTAV